MRHTIAIIVLQVKQQLGKAMTHYITHKMPRARKESKFTVYPFAANENKIQLQSDHHCMLVIVDLGRTFVSKRYAQYPRFAGCHPANGGKIIDTPVDIKEQLDIILQSPTGKIVNLT